jgi:transglutaminase-like putative cysteine protease
MTAPLRLKFGIELSYEVQSGGAEFVFNIEASRTARQTVVSEKLGMSAPVSMKRFCEHESGTRFLRVSADEGPLVARYDAVVDINHHHARPSSLDEYAVADLPDDVLKYINPSRYCESDKLFAFAAAQFGGLPRGYTRAQAICDWVASNVAFRSNSTDGETSACDVMVKRQGVCRDFAHLMIALCRASSIPARFTSGIDYGADPSLGPQDFHAYVECYVGGGWYIFDPSGTAIPMGFVRLGTGRDAAEAAFATLFGGVWMRGMQISIEAVPGRDGVLRAPRHTEAALSTDDGRGARP